MSFEHFDQFFTFAAAGIGLFLAGLLNLVLGQGGRRVWLRFAVTLVVCGAVVAGLSAFTRVELALRAAAVVFGVLAAVTLFSSEWLARQVSAVVAFFRRPAARWGLVAGGGLLVLIGSGFAFERAEDLALNEGMKDLEMLVGRPVTQPSDRAFAATDRGTRIVLREPITARSSGDLAGPEEKTLRDAKVHTHLIRRGDAADHANCHGWVFTGGKFHLAPDDVETILKENGYQETHEPQPGDLAIYRQGGAITHTAVVRYVAESQPVLVEGKWGAMGVFLHQADKSFYGTDITFYRSARAGHLLTGLGGSPGPAVEAIQATE